MDRTAENLECANTSINAAGSIDPCAGKKGELDYFKWRQKSNGQASYSDGAYRANEHIFNRHVDPTKHLGASKYVVSKAPISSENKMWIVNLLNQETFLNGTATVNGSTIVYSYAFPVTHDLFGNERVPRCHIPRLAIPHPA